MLVKYIYLKESQRYLDLTNTSNFRPLEVVGRGREIQLQVGEN